MRRYQTMAVVWVWIGVCIVSARAEIAATVPGHHANVGYSATTGEIWFDDWTCTSWEKVSPTADGLAVVHLLSETGIFTNLEAADGVFNGIFDVALPGKIFKFSPFGELDITSLGSIAEPGLSLDFLQADLEFDSSAVACEAIWNGLNYFPPPNLSVSDGNASGHGTVTYKAVNGEVLVSGTPGTAVPWIGLYSADSIFENATDARDIATRVQYAFDVNSSASLGSVSRPGLSADMLLRDLTMVASDESGQPVFGDFYLAYIAVGDVNEDRVIDMADIDSLTMAILDSVPAPTTFDLNGDGFVNADDRMTWVHDVMHTYMGDSNLDGLFDSTDLSIVFQAGEYFDGIPGNSTWGTGDWNGDGDFNSGDLVAAFKDNGYEKGPRPSLTVPEANVNGFGFAMALGIVFRRRRAV